MDYVENDPAGVRSVADLPNRLHSDGPHPADVPAASTKPPLPPEPDSPVIDGVEDDGVWRHYRAETLALLRPVGFAEIELAEVIVLLSWRLRRVGRLEADALHDGFVRQKEAAGSPPRGRIGACERVLAVICRYEGRLQRARDRAAKELRALQKARKADGTATPEPATSRPTEDAPSPGAGVMASFGRTAEGRTGDPMAASSGSSEALASSGNTARVAAASTPRPATTPALQAPERPGASEPGAVASFGQIAEPGTRGPDPAPHDPSPNPAAIGQTPAGAVASFGQNARAAGSDARPAGSARARTRNPGRPAPRLSPVGRPPQPDFVPQPEYVEEGAEEDAWTYSSYKAYWAERDAAERAARLGLPAPGNPDLETIEDPGP